jgi:acetyl-CoA carboxylase biotin carboxyl carrier protein
MDIERIEALVNLMKDEGIAELTVESPDFKVSIKRDPAGASVAVAPSPGAEGGAAEPMRKLPPAETGPLAVTSPAVGRLQLAEGTAVGQVVAAGQVLAIVEAMRIPNEVRAPGAGTIVEVLVTEGAVVEYGQPLMMIEPSAEVVIDETEL